MEDERLMISGALHPIRHASELKSAGLVGIYGFWNVDTMPK